MSELVSVCVSFNLFKVKEESELVWMLLWESEMKISLLNFEIVIWCDY